LDIRVYLINVRNMAHIKLPTLALPQAAGGGNDLQCRVAVNVLNKQLRAFQGEHWGLAESWHLYYMLQSAWSLAVPSDRRCNVI